jgi:hypothetical protein
MRWSENSLLGSLPQYQLVKSVAEGLAHVESAESVNPALVSIEGGWQIGYLLEPLENGWVTVFLPQAPTQWVLALSASWRAGRITKRTIWPWPRASSCIPTDRRCEEWGEETAPSVGSPSRDWSRHSKISRFF